MNFETANILAEELALPHENIFYKVYSDPIIMKYIGSPVSAKNIKQAWLASNKQQKKYPIVRKTWALKETSANGYLGIAAIAVEKNQQAIATIGCMFTVDAHGKGYATEVLRKVTELAFNRYSIKKLTSYSVLANKASHKLMIKLGYSYKKILTDHDETKAGYYWSLSRREWLDLLKINNG